MKTVISALLLSVLSVASIAQADPAQCNEVPILSAQETGAEPVVYVPSNLIPNFRRVNDWLYRGGEPESQGLSLMRSKLGVSVIVNLIGDTAKQADVATEKTKWLANAPAGTTYVTFPMTNSMIYLHSVTEITRALNAVLKAHAGGAKVFVHCQGGRDRTGIVVAALRIASGCTFNQAAGEYQNTDGQPYRAGLPYIPLEALTDPRDPSPVFIPTIVMSLADFADAQK